MMSVYPCVDTSRKFRAFSFKMRRPVDKLFKLLKISES